MRMPCLAPSTSHTASRAAVVVHATKGFGSSKSKSSQGKQGKQSKANKRTKKSKGKTGYRQRSKLRSDGAADAGPQEQTTAARPLTELLPPEGVSMATTEEPAAQPEEPKMSVADEVAFEERLKSLKADSSLLAKEKAIKTKSDAPLGATIAEDVYKNPPSIMDTMTGTTDDNKDKVDVFGSNRAAALGASIFLAVILLVGTIGLDGGGGAPPKASQDPLSAEERKQLEAQRDEFASRLASDSNDVEAIEALAVTNANLGDYSQAEKLLSQLVEIKSDDPDAWRLLGETRTALGRNGDAVAAYRAGRERAREDLGLLKGVAGALVQDGKPELAVQELQGEAEWVRARAASGEAAEPGQRALGAVEVDLLLAKVYSQWKGHTGDALAVYERVIAENPEDFRGYLAKGVLLRSEGRKGDADRAFLQARFLAPKELRAVVDRVAVPEN